MKWINLAVLLFLPLVCVAQIGGEDEVYLSGDRIEAKFNGGGIEKFREFVNKEFDNSKVTKPGKMVAAFTVDTDGSVKNIKLVEFIDSDSAIEMIRVLNACPKWEPAKRNGKPISIEIKYPMVFKPKATAAKVVPQKKATDSISNPEDKIYNTSAVESKPEFPGGIKEFYAYVAHNYKVPNVKGLSGKVFVKFVIEKDGSVTDIKVIRDIGYGSGEEAIRMLSKCPKWIPGQQMGKPVRVEYMLPINIKT